jgi:hypothetical protein
MMEAPFVIKPAIASPAPTNMLMLVKNEAPAPIITPPASWSASAANQYAAIVNNAPIIMAIAEAE